MRIDSASPELGEAARADVGRIGRVLPGYGACRAGESAPTCREDLSSSIDTVFVEGHADVTGPKDPIERDRRNRRSSADRSVNAYRAPLAESPGLHLLRDCRGQQIVSVSGYSSTRPLDPGGGADASPATAASICASSWEPGASSACRASRHSRSTCGSRSTASP